MVGITVLGVCLCRVLQCDWHGEMQQMLRHSYIFTETAYSLVHGCLFIMQCVYIFVAICLLVLFSVA